MKEIKYYLYDKDIADAITRYGNKAMNDVYKQYMIDYSGSMGLSEEEKLEKERENKRKLRKQKLNRIFNDI